MTINLKVPDLTELKPRITVFGVGGAGGNAVNNMIASGLRGIEFVVANTDAQALLSSSAERRIQMGAHVTEGLGAGSKPDIGAAAAEEAMADIKAHLASCHMTFITAGMGGGTGTGAAPVIARASREEGILTVGVVTKPFQFEGQRRMRAAEAGILELQKYVDTLLVIPNQNLFRVANEKTTFADAFAMADDVLRAGVSCITDLMVKEGLINLDFADVRTIMAGMGKAMMGTGELSGDRRAIEAAEAAISNPLLDDVSMKGASGLLVSITGGNDLTLYEVDEAAERIRAEADPDANIIVGATFDDELDGSIRVSVVATGLGMLAADRSAHKDRESLTQRLAGLASMPSPVQVPAPAPAPMPMQAPAARFEPAKPARVQAEAPNDVASLALAVGQRHHRTAAAAIGGKRAAAGGSAATAGASGAEFRSGASGNGAAPGAAHAECRGVSVAGAERAQGARRRRSRAGSCRAKEEGRIPRAPDRRCPSSQGGRRRQAGEARARVHRAEAGVHDAEAGRDAAQGLEDRAAGGRQFGYRHAEADRGSAERRFLGDPRAGGRITCRRRFGNPRISAQTGEVRVN